MDVDDEPELEVAVIVDVVLGVGGTWLDAEDCMELLEVLDWIIFGEMTVDGVVEIPAAADDVGNTL